MSKIYPDFKIHFEILNETIYDPEFEIPGDESLLKIAFDNLLKNAYSYSDNKEVNISILQQENKIKVVLVNSGPVPENIDPKFLFNAFTRGSNAKQSKGYGLGLRIVLRIMQFHQAEILYLIPDNNTNKIEVFFEYKHSRKI